MRLGSTRRDLRADIEACGYFPDLVEEGVLLAVGEEELLDFVVHHEPTFAHDEIHRHVTVLALTPTRLIVGHTDDQPGRAAGHRHRGGLVDGVGGAEQDQLGGADPGRHPARAVPARHRRRRARPG